MAKKVPAARLVLGGAPESWHTVNGLPGHFHPTIPTPLDQPGLATSEQAQAFIAAHTERVSAAAADWEDYRQRRLDAGQADIGAFDTPVCPIELVEINPSEVETAAEQARQVAQLGARLVAAARRGGRAKELVVQSETAAVTDGADPQES